MSPVLRRTFNKIIRGKLKLGDRRKAHRNTTDFRRRAYDPV
jgi:hypothetical protein